MMDEFHKKISHEFPFRSFYRIFHYDNKVRYLVNIHANPADPDLFTWNKLTFLSDEYDGSNIGFKASICRARACSRP